MRKETEISILRNKFRKWFGKNVPVATPLPDKAVRSIENPVPAALPLTSGAYYQITRRRHVDGSPNLLKFLSFGFIGAGCSGAIVGFIFFTLNRDYWGWYPDNWPHQYIIIFFAMVIGFTIGLAKGYVSQQRETYSYKDKLID